MPYIAEPDRKDLDPTIDHLIVDLTGDIHEAAGKFTYVVYRLLKALFLGKYWVRALGIGCLICAILELYRKEHSKYEDQKIKENGDV